MLANGSVICRICAEQRGARRSRRPRNPAATAVHTLSPEISAGYAKNRNARAASAGLMKFMPVPPKISFANTTPKLMPSAACHSGVVGGRISGKRMPVTKKPSFTSTLRTMANRTSHDRPTTIVTMYSGRK